MQKQPPQLPTTFSLYIHWPYCLSKCPYCDFNSHVRKHHDVQGWLKAIEREIDYYSAFTSGRHLKSIFFGGGTPSLIPPDVVEKLLVKIKSLWTNDASLEVTLEANPTSSEAKKFSDLALAGVNRFSLGLQALNDADLKFLGREHNAQEALQAIDYARKSTAKISFDLIYARPKQSLKAWEEELHQALALGTHHLSLYQLTIEPGTQFYTRHKAGILTLPNEQLAADFYELTGEITAKAGFEAYEISNYARFNRQCLHNLTYWRYEDYIGLGPGAHGRLEVKDGNIITKIALQNHKAPEIWQEQVLKKGNGLKSQIPLPPFDQAVETLMMGLRLEEGVPLRKLNCFYKIFEPGLKTMIQAGYLHPFTSSHLIKPTLQGRLCLNSVLEYLIRAAEAQSV